METGLAGATPVETSNTHFLLPGNIFAHRTTHVVTTLLGSCISVCLWDPVCLIGGINHYMLPLWNGEGLASPRYGNIAIPKLIEKMLKLGTTKRNLVAKVFGGGEVFRTTNAVINIGDRNIALANDMLKEEQIPIVGTNVGGKTGRKIVFYTSSGRVLLKKLNLQIDDIKI